ncbi:MAG: DUF2937 family protein [Dethiobacteria bacterium]|nr:DUF2937 family protein [Dethiobacteria bacterium]
MFKAIRHPLRLIDGILDRVFSIIGAVAFSQFPQFFGQYMQRLGGHLAEAKRALAQYIAAAEALNLTLEEYIREHLESGSEVFTSSGEVIQGLLERVQTLELSYQALQDATIYNRWLVFLREVDWSIATGTWENFVPGVPTTVEGLTYALAGLLLGWGVYTLFKTLASVPFAAFKTKGPGQ